MLLWLKSASATFNEAWTSPKKDRRDHVGYRMSLKVRKKIPKGRINDNLLECKGAELWVGHGRVRFPVAIQFHKVRGQGTEG